MKSHEELLNEVARGDNLLKTMLKVLKPPGEAVFYIGGAYILEAIQGLDPGGILLVCAENPAAAADALCDHFSVPPVKVTWLNEVLHIYPEGKKSRGITIMPMSGRKIEDHLAESGFTAHSMAVDLGGGPPFNLIDPLGGVSDLARKKLRISTSGAVEGNPDRVLTAVELFSRYGLKPDGETADELKRASIGFNSVPPRRVWARILRLFDGDKLSLKAGFLRETGVLDAVFPELKAIYDIPQNYYHHLGVWDHTMEVLDNIEYMLGALPKLFPLDASDIEEHLSCEIEKGLSRRTLLSFMGLIHDIGKGKSMSVLPSGRIRFKGHEEQGAKLTESIVGRLDVGRKANRYMVEFSRKHMELGYLMDKGENTAGRLKTIFDLGDSCVDTSIHSIADRMATRGEAAGRDAAIGFERMAKRVIRDYFWLKRETRLIDGNDVLVHGGLTRGPEVGEILMKVLVAQREGLVENRRQALEFIAPDFKGRMMPPPP